MMIAHPGSEVRVLIRSRPTANFAQELIEYLPDGQTVSVHQRKDSRKGVVNNQLSSWSFRLDGVLHDVSQEEVYGRVGRGVVLGALEGYNGTVMCFGQTGAGKTYTMTGATENYKQRGIIPRALQEVFHEVEQRSDHAFSVHLSFLEIYNETLVDLLASVRGCPGVGPGGMAVVEEAGGGVSVRGLSLHPVHSEEAALNLLFEGEMNRIIGAHALNKNSSRSHCILTVHIESRSRTLSDAKYVTSKLNLVDLAGSERLGKTGSEGQVLKEAMYINKSLSFLEQAILALADRRRDHVPFRQTKLTHALKDSLGGNCNTVLVANIYGEASQIEETLSTLRFASRMKCVQMDPVVNEHTNPVLQVRKLEKEIQLLKQELSIHNTLANRMGMSYDALSETQVAEIQSQVRRYLEGSLDEINIVSIRQIHEVFTQFKQAVQQQDQKVKAQLCQNYTLVEKAQSTSGSTAAKSQGSQGTVGVVEGHGFGVGLAVPSDRHIRLLSPGRTKAIKTKELASQGRKEAVEARSPGPGKQVESVNPVQRDREGREHDPQSQEPQGPQEPLRTEYTHTYVPLYNICPVYYMCYSMHRDNMSDLVFLPTSSPPPKAEAFEDFKAERGSEINRILKENKVVLLERRARLRELTECVNTAKREIDSTSTALHQWRDKRQSQGQFVSAEGVPVLDEAELSLTLHLRELKTQYRQQYEELRGTKAEVSYCQHLVDQCRTRLLTEFESWYNESFLLPEEVQAMLRSGGPIRPGLVPVYKALALEEDEQEHFERLRYELLADSPSAISFYNAQNRTVQRRNYSKAMSQTPVQKTTPRGSGRTKLPAILSVI
ncbi:kinesin-like protein KIF9 isoform X1 [Oncorhynchus masou masou]|uniref:kinesin-like protein KIF9 isoform X1 n=1 Tax=Oncorhynchus masou masou TaxID=90313 RepID=UPI00318358FE